MSEQPQPLPCPYCGGTEFDWNTLELEQPISGDHYDVIRVHCLGCHATGPGAACEQTATQGWNLPARPKAGKAQKERLHAAVEAESRPELPSNPALILEILAAPGRHLMAWDGAWTETAVEELLSHPAFRKLPATTDSCGVGRPKLPSEYDLAGQIAKDLEGVHVTAGAMAVWIRRQPWALSLLRGGEGK